MIRVLDKNTLADIGEGLNLDDLGIDSGDVDAIRRAVRDPHGLVLMPGPTGSGKTTTLYSAIAELTSGEEKIITIEDPIEYQIDGIVQIAVHEKRSMTFSSGLRAILRHDPDRVVVGEIRDLETATSAVQAAMTGHLVLASVHANSSFDVISRFSHWGIDLHDLVSALTGVFAQRLLRKLCSHCARPAKSNAEIQTLADANFREPVGCDHCFGTGYQGRTAVIEHLNISPTMAELMVARAPAARLREAAQSAGMRTLRQAALAKAAEGVTSLAEVNRVTFAE